MAIINGKYGCLVSGRATRDAEYKSVGEKNTPLTKFSLAVYEDKDNKDTIFINITAWSDLAEQSQKIKKGDRILVYGNIREYEYNDKSYKELVADFIIESIKPQLVTLNEAVESAFMTLDDDDDNLPF